MQFLCLVADEFGYIAEMAGNPNANDYIEITKMKGGELIKEIKQIKLRNVKQLLRRIELSVGLT